MNKIDTNTPPLRQLITDLVSNSLSFLCLCAVALVISIVLTVEAALPEGPTSAKYTKTYHSYNEVCINGVVYYTRANAYFPSLQRNGLPYQCEVSE